MRVDTDNGRPEPAPLAAPSTPMPQGTSAPPAPKPGAGPSPIPMPADRVDRTKSTGGQLSDGVSALAGWAKAEWSTVAGAAHGLASVPGVVSKAWQDAAQTNTNLANAIRSTVDHWGAETATVRQTEIDGLQKAAAPVSKTASTVAHDLGEANRLPLAVDKTVDAVLRGMPGGAKQAIKDIANSASAGINKLPAPVEARARAAAHTLDLAAAAQTTKASTTVASVSALVGQTVTEFRGRLSGTNAAAKLLDKVPVLADTPVFGLGLTAAATVNDVRAGKSIVDATIANLGGTLVGTAVGSAVTEGITATIDAAAIADGTAAALGAAAAAGPAGWAVAGGVVASVAVGYGVYKAVESKAGQDIIDGATHLDRNKIQLGLGEAHSEIFAIAKRTGHWASDNIARLQP